MSQPEQEHRPEDFRPMKHGEFCWTEIGTTDAEKCMDFYEKVFGWTFKKDDGAGGMAYNEFSTGAEYPAGGLYNMDPQWFGGHAPPPHFMIYVAVNDVDATTAKAEELGATIKRPPMDIPGIGRMSVIQDPTGAHIATFNPKR